MTTNKLNFKLNLAYLLACLLSQSVICRQSYNEFIFSVSNDDNLPKPTPYKWKYYIRRYQPDLSRLELMDRGINPDTLQLLLPISSPEAKPSKANIKPVATVKSKAPDQKPPANAATPSGSNKTPTSTPRKRKGAKNAAPSAKKKASPQETKVRNILNRASSAPGQGRVRYYFFPPTDTLPDLPDLEGDDKLSAVLSPNVPFFCTCTQAPTLLPITSSFKVTNDGTIIILDTDTD